MPVYVCVRKRAAEGTHYYYHVIPLRAELNCPPNFFIVLIIWASNDNVWAATTSRLAVRSTKYVAANGACSA